MKLKIIVLTAAILLASCGDKRKILEDNTTGGVSIESVALSDNESISQGNMRFIQGDFNTAIEYYQEAMQQNKATAFYNIGVCYYLLGNLPQAELNFRESVLADPGFDEAVMNLVAVLAQQEKITEAEKFITRIIRTAKSPRVYTDMANISLKTGDTAKAAYYYKQALDADPRSPFVLSNYANFLISIGEYQDGINILERFEDKDFSINYNLAYAYYRLGDPSGAYSYANEALYSKGATEEGYNKLAYLFYDLGRFGDEAQTLRILIASDPQREYKMRLVTSYMNAADFDRALDELSGLLKEYPADVPLNMLNYEALILAGKIPEGGKFIREAYGKLGGDTVLYYYTKHLSMFERSAAETRPLIFVKRENGWLNLARTVYSLHEGDYIAAGRFLEKVPPEAGHDYYAYKTFLLIKNKSFREAKAAADKMDKYRGDTFWYKLVIAWNLKEPDDVLSLADEYKSNPVAKIRVPYFKFDLSPVIDDMSFSYRFDDRGTDAAAMLAYPVFLEPDEVVQFLIMGRTTLKDVEKENATKKLEGMKRNNEGIDAYYAYDFDSALYKFRQAGELLANNSEVSYNEGITYFNLGDDLNAAKSFERALVQNKSNPHASFGLGLVNYRQGNVLAAANFFEQAKKSAVMNIEESETPKLDDVRAVYLSLMAGDRFGKREEAQSIARSDDALVESCDWLMRYFEDYDRNFLKNLEGSPVFRVSLVGDLLDMRHRPVTSYEETDHPDRYYTLARKFIMLRRGGGDVTKLNPRFAADKVYLKDMVYYSVFQKDAAAGLRYLQTLTRLDFKYRELYKVSLYYFTWKRDFVNAEASYGSLARLGYEDRTTAFYMLLYFLANYNDARLKAYLNSYEETYEADYRSGVVSALINLNAKNIGGFYEIMKRLLGDDPYLFDKMFIEVDFEKF